MKKTTVELLQRLAVTATTVVYGVSFTGNLLPLENADAINSALGTASFKTVKSEDADSQDTEYYKSDYEDLGSLIQAGADMTEEVMSEGAVLLKNDNNALPLASASKVSVFGVTSADPIYGGTGSGSVDASKAVSFYDGFENAGLEQNPTLKEN